MSIALSKIGTNSTGSGGATSIALTTTGDAPINSVVAVAIGWEVGSLADVVSSVADSVGGNTWHIETNTQIGGGDVNLTWAWAVMASDLPTSSTITATFSVSESFRSIAGYDIAGLLTSGTKDFFSNTPTGAATGTAPVVTGTPAQALSIALGGTNVFAGQTDTFTENGGSGPSTFTTLDAVTGSSGMHTAYYLTPSTATVTYAPLLGTSREFAAAMLTLKGSGAGVPASAATLSMMGV